MSLPNRVEVLERSMLKEQNKRKLLKELVFEMMDRQHMRLTDKGKQALLEIES